MASSILPLFWNLASSSKDTRLEASADLVTNLENFQQSFRTGRTHTNGDATSSSDDEDDGGDRNGSHGRKVNAPETDDESGVEVDESDDGMDNGESDVEAARLDSQMASRNAEDVTYTVKRLVRGLASSRESSRLGFAVALTELLSRLPTISAEQVISLILRNSRTNKDMKGSDQRDALFARLFGLTAVVQSGCLFAPSASVEAFSSLVQSLQELGRKKAWLRESAWWSVILAVEGLAVSQPSWTDEGFTSVVEALQAEKNWTQEKLALGIRLEVLQPHLDWNSLLSPALKHAPILSSQNLVNLAKILREADVQESDSSAPGTSTGAWKPQLHFIWNIILESILSQGKTSLAFPDFWRVVVDESLFANTSSSQRRYWGFQIFTLALPRIPSSQIPLVFTPNFMRCWINNLSSQDRYLHKAAQQAARAVQLVVKDNSQVGFALLTRLIGKAGRMDFDKVTKTKTVEGIMASLTLEGVGEYVKYLQNVVLGAEDSDMLEQRRQWAIDQLHDLCKNPSIPREDGWIQTATDFLLVHGLFSIRKVNKNSPSAVRLIPQLQILPKPELSEATVKRARDQFFSSIIDLTTWTTPRQGTERPQGTDASGQLWFIKALDRVAVYASDTKHVELRVPVDEEISRLREEGRSLLFKLPNVKGQHETEVRGAQILLSYAILQTYGDQEDMLEILEDVKAAVEHMFTLGKGQATSSKSADPEPIDMMLDTLILLLDKGSADLRNLANLIVGLVAPSFTRSSIDHLVAQLESVPAVEGAEIEADGLGAAGGSEDDDDDDEATEDDISSAEIEDDADEEDDGSEDDSDEDAAESDGELDEDEDMGAVDPAFRKKVADALKLAGMTVEDEDAEMDGEHDDDSDEDEEDEEVWDDDQMMKVDEQLAAVFRERRNAVKKTDTKRLLVESVHFKARILDLFDTFLRRLPESPLIIHALVPLLRLTRNTNPAEADLASKATGILRTRIHKSKEVAQGIDLTEASTVLTHVHNLARKAGPGETMSLCSMCSIYITRSVEGSDPTCSAAVEVYRKTLKEFITRKHSSLNPTFLADWFKRFPTVSWELRDDILRYISSESASVNVFRQLSAYSLLQVYSQNLATLAKSQRNEVKAATTSIRKSIYETLSLAATGTATEWKADKLKELVKFACHLARSTKAVFPDESGELWSAKEFEQVEKNVQEGQTRDMKGVLGLCAQLRAIISGAQGKGKKSSQPSANGTTEIKSMQPQAEKAKAKKRKDGGKEQGKQATAKVKKQKANGGS